MDSLKSHVTAFRTTHLKAKYCSSSPSSLKVLISTGRKVSTGICSQLLRAPAAPSRGHTHACSEAPRFHRRHKTHVGMGPFSVLDPFRRALRRGERLICSSSSSHAYLCLIVSLTLPSLVISPPAMSELFQKTHVMMMFQSILVLVRHGGPLFLFEVPFASLSWRNGQRSIFSRLPSFSLQMIFPSCGSRADLPRRVRGRWQRRGLGSADDAARYHCRRDH